MMSLRPRLTPEQKRAKEEGEIERHNLEKRAESAESIRKSRRRFATFTGRIHYLTEFFDIAQSCENLLDKARQSGDLLVLGFDLEWPFSYKTGPGRTATIQISPDDETCCIYHVSNIQRLPKGLSELLVRSNVRITGNCVKNDVRKLARDFPGWDVEKAIENCVDLSQMANRVLATSRRWSLEDLVDNLLDLNVDKSKKVRMSRWDKVPLTDEQKRYAATDSYVSLVLYDVLKSREMSIENRTETF
ncbi:unnamed protein product [Phyllotreta striolata]|uniref:3'-5' exonuclease n=1 Tax=Phyllotreta striolata TaxID=444603 RepID=A0A9P0DMD9_PHYSR|nr:unnamed protein product [Phyllotreta striolata]